MGFLPVLYLQQSFYSCLWLSIIQQSLETQLFIILLFSDFDTAKLFALFVFVIATITDAYDGHLARKYNQITPEGKFLDPLADKILVVSAFLSFAVIGIIDYWHYVHTVLYIGSTRSTYTYINVVEVEVLEARSR